MLHIGPKIYEFEHISLKISSIHGLRGEQFIFVVAASDDYHLASHRAPEINYINYTCPDCAQGQRRRFL